MTNWKYKVNIKPFLQDDKEEYTREECQEVAHKIVGVLQPLNDIISSHRLAGLIWAFINNVEDQEEFNSVLDDLYDWADDKSVWLGI